MVYNSYFVFFFSEKVYRDIIYSLPLSRRLKEMYFPDEAQKTIFYP